MKILEKREENTVKVGLGYSLMPVVTGVGIRNSSAERSVSTNV